MRTSEIYALHVEEERYHQAHEYLECARRALPPGSPARASLDALAAGVAGEWRAVREAIIQLHYLGAQPGGESGSICHVPRAATAFLPCMLPSTPLIAAPEILTSML